MSYAGLPPVLAPLSELQNHWIVVPRGRSVYELVDLISWLSPDVFVKLADSDWRLYGGQTSVVVAGMEPGPTARGMMPEIKLWLGHDPFTVSVGWKRPIGPIRPRAIVFISDYTLEEVFGDEACVMAMWFVHQPTISSHFIAIDPFSAHEVLPGGDTLPSNGHVSS